MVAAAIFSRHGPASRSAARRNTAVRSSNGVASQSALAAIAASIASDASECSALVKVPNRAECRWGWTTSTRWPPAHAVDAADDVGQVDRVLCERSKLFDDPGALTRIRCVVVDRLVHWKGHVGDGVHAARMG